VRPTRRETSTTTLPLSESEEAFWRLFARAILVLPRGLEADLKSATGLSSAEYGTLMNLSEAPQHQLRMNDLANAIALSASRASRIVDGLERRGLLVRSRSEVDGRGQIVTLERSGLERLEGAWPAHLRSVRNRVVGQINPNDIPAVTSALSAMLEHAQSEIERK